MSDAQVNSLNHTFRGHILSNGRNVMMEHCDGIRFVRGEIVDRGKCQKCGKALVWEKEPEGYYFYCEWCTE